MKIMPAAGLSLALLFCSCAKAPPAQMEFALGTLCGINLFEDGNAALYARIFSRIREIDRTMSVRAADFQELLTTPLPGVQSRPLSGSAASLVSGVALINENAGLKAVQVRGDILEVLERALYYAEKSSGAFDPTVGPLVKLWGIGTDHERVPSDAEIAEALTLINWRDLEIDRAAGTAFLRRQGMSLDLGGIAKGYAADEAARIAREAKVQRAIFDLGGNIFALGAHKDASPWHIGVQDPLKERGSYIGVVPVQNKSIVTSSVYERFFKAEGRRYHHILSTADGWPIQNGLLSVTIVTENSMDADALSTAVFALGYEKGSALLETLPNVEAIFVFEDRGVAVTRGLRGVFELAGEGYWLMVSDTFF
jgi:thiamine biosynthesis lipoprotein